MKRTVWLVAVAAAVLFPFAAPSITAANGGDAQVTLSVTGGNLAYELSGGTMTPVSFDYGRTGATATKGTVTLTVDDARGTFEGWSLVVEATSFEYSGLASGNNDISASRATIVPGSPKLLAGSGLKGISAGGSGSLDSKRIVLSAESGSGSGAFSQDIEIHLDIPANSPAGTYTTLLTVSTSEAPSSAT